MSMHHETWLDVGASRCRVWEKGEGPTLGFLAGWGGLPKWSPFLDELARYRRVVVPSLPGFPGGGVHQDLHDHLDWLIATRDLVSAAGLDGADLVAVSAGAALAADLACIWPTIVQSLVLIGPLGIFDVDDPVADIWAQHKGPDVRPSLFCANPQRYIEQFSCPTGEDELEWEIMLGRADEAATTFLFPFCDTKLERRLHRIECPTLILRGENDQVLPASYPSRLASLILGRVECRAISKAGHFAELDQPFVVAKIVQGFLSDTDSEV